MKKVLFGLFALSTVAFAAETNIYLRAGADFGGEFDIVRDEETEANKKDADDFAWEIAVEATREVYPRLELGLGIAYQDHGAPEKSTNSYTDEDDWQYVDNIEMPAYTSIPLYAVAKYNFDAINNFVPYIKANLGYSFNDEDGNVKTYGTEYDPSNDDLWVYDEEIDTKVKNGLYYGIGAGFEYNNFTMDLMYQVNEAEAEITFEDGEKLKKDYDYSRVTLSFGYKFNFEFKYNLKLIKVLKPQKKNFSGVFIILKYKK